MPSNQALDVQNLSFRYSGGTHALENVSLSMEPGETVAVIGPSGCGKSTLLELVGGLLQPTAGRVVVGGEVTSRGRFSYMPQKDSLLPWRTAEDNAALLLELGSETNTRARAQARATLHRFGLIEFARAKPHELSGGMRQRIALIRSILPGKDVLLDEPFGALDAITRSDLQVWLLEVQSRLRLSMLLVTHDIDEAILLGDRVYVLSPRPATVVGVVPVPFGRDRTIELTTTPDFAGLKRELFHLLRPDSSAANAGHRAA